MSLFLHAGSRSNDAPYSRGKRGYHGRYRWEAGEAEHENRGDPVGLVYPSWHPSGRFIAFSVNATRQDFHSADRNRVEVYDLASDVVLYDVEKHEIFTTAALFSKDRFETTPTFSPDGKSLYFSTAEACDLPNEYESVKYSLCRIDFNPETKQFGSPWIPFLMPGWRTAVPLFPGYPRMGSTCSTPRGRTGLFDLAQRGRSLYLQHGNGRALSTYAGQ